MTESEWIDRYMRRLGELLPKAPPMDYLEYCLNGYLYGGSDITPEDEAALFAADLDASYLELRRGRLARSRRNASRRVSGAGQVMAG